MRKLSLQFVFIVASFFVTWLILSRVDWMDLFNVRENSNRLEEKLGDLYWEFFNTTEKEILDHEIVSPLDELLTVLCTSNKIPRDEIKLHIIKREEINAFALPDNHIVVFTGLIRESENEAELCGVLAHELAHLELGHLMRKLVREVGLSVLISMSSGSSSPGMIRQAMQVLTSSAFDRQLERDADQQAVRYMANSKLQPEGLANFLYKMSATENRMPDQLFWLSTHPGGEERAMDILKEAEKMSIEEEKILTTEEWDQLQEQLETL